MSCCIDNSDAQSRSCVMIQESCETLKGPNGLQNTSDPTPLSLRKTDLDTCCLDSLRRRNRTEHYIAFHSQGSAS